MAFSFKAMVEADRRRTFLNLDEFGEKHTVEAEPSPPCWTTTP